MNVRYIAFSRRGEKLALRLAEKAGGEVCRCNREASLRDWTEQAFLQAEGLVFVGAAGIAVRAIAPHVRHKTTDPAVVVADEGGSFFIPILSGHLGGANELARTLAAICGGTPVITTATDVNGLFAVDEWAKRQKGFIRNPERIREVSGKLLAGEKVTFASRWPIVGKLPPRVEEGTPEDCDFLLGYGTENPEALCIVPKIFVLGMGCRKGAPEEQIETRFQAFLHLHDLPEQAVVKVCSIDRKGQEPGILAFCRKHGYPYETFSAEELRKAEGAFASSSFVAETVGVDNVCERSAVLGSGGKLVCPKYAGEGVTLALAEMPYTPDWRWQDE